VRPEEKLGLVSVVDAAQQAKVLDRRFASSRERDDVVEFQEAPLVTAPASFGHECAAPTVAGPDRTLDLGLGARLIALASCPAQFRDMPGAGRRTGAGPRTVSRSQFLSREVVEQHRQCTVEDRARIAVGNHVSQQILREPQLLARVLRNGELDFVPIGGERRNDPRRRRRRRQN
jgi:hypothetical protein